MTQHPSTDIPGATLLIGNMQIDAGDWHKANPPIHPTGRRSKETFQHPVKVTESSPIYDGVKRDTTDLDAEEAITRAERAMAEGDRGAALAAVLEARDLLLDAAVLETVMTIQGGGQL